MQYGLTPVLIDRDACRDYERSSKLEWLETNATGAYAMGTVCGANSRRYHGLLVASLDPPVQRKVLLAKVDEQVAIESANHDLGTNQYPAAVYPRGFSLLNEFRQDPFPVWTWQLGAVTVTRKVFLIPGRQAVVIEYNASAPCSLSVRPMLAFRDYHSLNHNHDFDAAVESHPLFVRVKPCRDLCSLTFNHSGGCFQTEPLWFYNVEYLVELERGMDFHEDLYSPGTLRFDVHPGTPVWIVADTDENERYDLDRVAAIESEIRKQRQLAAEGPFEVKLEAAANQFRAVRADGRPTIMAGFPWFADWGRDTMISAPGLLIHRGLLDEACRVIEGFLYHLDQGLIPNLFLDVGAPNYNTCDATFWMFQAVWAYTQSGGDIAWVKRVFYPAAKTIIDWHLRGTLYNIHADPDDGLLYAATDGVQLTWMDARVGDWVVTPRGGKPVEVCALWYNALRMAELWATEFTDIEFAHQMAELANKVERSFVEKFWNAELSCLYDVLGPDGPNAKIRPNQLFAVSLAFNLLSREQAQGVVSIVKDKLLTPVGLRTLAPDDPDYKPHYSGNRVERDGAYHQGTVWPWLLGPFVTAYLKAFGRNDENVAWCRALVGGMESQLLVTGLGTISEVYGGDTPHLPGGCIAQAWSVAELLRLLRTDLAL